MARHWGPDRGHSPFSFTPWRSLQPLVERPALFCWVGFWFSGALRAYIRQRSPLRLECYDHTVSRACLLVHRSVGGGSAVRLPIDLLALPFLMFCRALQLHDAAFYLPHAFRACVGRLSPPPLHPEPRDRILHRTSVLHGGRLDVGLFGDRLATACAFVIQRRLRLIADARCVRR